LDVPNQVIENCKLGDPKAFAELIKLTQRDVYSLAFRLAGNPQDAADISQDTYLRLLKKIKQFKGEAKFSTWLYQVTFSVAITHLRKRSKQSLDVAMQDDDWNTLPAPASADPAIQAQTKALHERLDQALQSLPAGYRTAVVMKDVYGFSLKEIAEQLKISEGTAKVRLFRARQRLRGQLFEEFGSGSNNPAQKTS